MWLFVQRRNIQVAAQSSFVLRDVLELRGAVYLIAVKTRGMYFMGGRGGTVSEERIRLLRLWDAGY